MAVLSNKIRYFLDSACRYFSKTNCPSCGSSQSTIVDRKMLVTALHECNKCFLLFRHPGQSLESNRAFYQRAYKQDDGITTQLPSTDEIERLKSVGFHEHQQKDVTRLVNVFESLGFSNTKLKILDYGCSWGYITFQLASRGFDVVGYEISHPRAEFGRKNLGVDIFTDEERLRDDNDVFLSSHVIEHVPNPTQMLMRAAELTSKNGFVITLCPNGSEQFKNANSTGFHKMWGEVHPNMITDKFFKNVARQDPYFLASTPEGWAAVRTWDQAGQVVADDLFSHELLFIWKPRSHSQT